MNSYWQNSASSSSLSQHESNSFGKSNNSNKPSVDEDKSITHVSNLLQKRSYNSVQKESIIMKIPTSQSSKGSTNPDKEEKGWQKSKQYTTDKECSRSNEEEQNFEKITKKVKTIVKSSNIGSVLDPAVESSIKDENCNVQYTYGRKSTDECPKPREKGGDQCSSKLEAEQLANKIRESLKNCKSVVVSFDSKIKELVFTIDCTDIESKETKVMSLTRKQMVEFDPRSVLYFYENHLDFPQDAEFKGRLKRV